MWARIENGTVAEITDIDPANRFHPSIPWVACPLETGIGWSYDGETFAPPPPEPLEDLAARQRAAIATALADALAAGLPYTMPDGSEDTVQMLAEDRQNLLGLAIEARDLQAAGVTDPVQEFRGLSNTRYPMTPDKTIALTDAALGHYKVLKARSWDRKDAIDAALAAGDREGIEAVVW